ncbi:MAG: cob(I)yrinic acid a,c-diamide adenosyltransferase [Sphingomonadaceae bacterium]|nr:cob(I)yrinic acid a,c-diamide adenosyltransferase [Sphingomonadaceae bacterium]
MVKLNKIYTRTGDDGTTGLVDGSRARKDSARIATIGDVDEANSLIGVAALHTDGGLLARLRTIQNDLFDLGADIATPDGIEGALRIVPVQITRLETEIDEMNAALSPLTSFILPGGNALAAALHVARAATRRAERGTVAAGIGGPALAYVNRLSDWLFVAARTANRGKDVLWTPGASR